MFNFDDAGLAFIAYATAKINGTRKTMGRRAGRLFSVVVATILLGFATPQLASAADWGGYANPAWSRCGSNSTVASTAIPGRAGLTGGYLQIKWSNGCPGNYARFVAASGHPAAKVALSIHAQVSPYNKAGTDEGRVDGAAWTYVIKLNKSSDRVCAYVDVTWFYQLPWEKVSKVLCA